MSRYLTPQEQADTINFWLKTREAQVPTTPLAETHIVLGGFDWPDPPIFPYTDRINALEGVCTISSCMGHQLENSELFYEGHLWFRLSAKNTKIFEKHAIELARMERVASLRKNYNLARSTKYWEWYEVEFLGGEPNLEESVLPIIGFFEAHFGDTRPSGEMHTLPEGEVSAEPDFMRSLSTTDTEKAGTEA